MAGRNPEKLGKHLLIAAILAVVFYVCAFAFIQHLRTFKGPWEVAFVSDAAGQPSIVITQRHYQILQTVRFAGARIEHTNLQTDVQFREAVTKLPFGEMLLQDPLYLPGSATMRLFGHVVELLPRTLIIDDKEYAWRSGKEIVVESKRGSAMDVHSGEFMSTLLSATEDGSAFRGGTGLWPIDFGVSPKSSVQWPLRMEWKLKLAANERRLSVLSWPAARETHAVTGQRPVPPAARQRRNQGAFTPNTTDRARARPGPKTVASSNEG